MSKENKNKMQNSTQTNPNSGAFANMNINPIVVVKKIKLKGSEREWGCLPEVVEEDEVSLQERPKEDNSSKSPEYNLSFIHTMNKEERNAHIQKCLEMSLENKITPKNAFALQLIDCMKFLVDEEKDFPTMACTLDASAKIYSYRVDSLHQQVTKLADEVILNMRRKKTNTNIEEKDDDEGLISTDRRKARKKGIIVSSESLRRKFKGKDPRSKFIQFEGVPGSITNRVRRDPKDLSYSLERDLPFWKDWDNYTPNRVGGTVRLPLSIKIIREEKSTDKLQLKTDSQTDAFAPAKESEINDVIDMEPTITNDEDDNDDLPSLEHDYDDNVEVEPDHKVDEDIEPTVKEVGVVAKVMERLSVGPNVSTSSRLEALKILFKESSEYHYLDLKNAHYWAGPEFWKRSNVRIQEEKKKGLKRKKAPVNIVYDKNLNNMIEKKWGSLFKKKYVLKNKTINKWKNNKLTLPQDLKIEGNLFFELFHLLSHDGPDGSLQDSNDLINTSGTDSTLNIEQDINNPSLYDVVEELSGSSSDRDALNSSFYEGIPGQSEEPEKFDALNAAFYDVGMVEKLTSTAGDSKYLGKVIRVQVCGNHETSFDETTLVPAPKLVTFEPIKYSVRPIQVDMRHLKETMMNIIREEINQDMQEKMSAPCTSSNANPIIPEARFSNILKLLPSKLEAMTARNMSVAMAFLALLTVTNENNLQLEDTNDSDVIIRFEF